MKRFLIVIFCFLIPCGSLTLAAQENNEARILNALRKKEQTDKKKKGIKDPFVMPGNVIVTARDESGRTWRVNGRLNRSMTDTQKEFTAAIEREKFKFQHEIPLGKEDNRKLLAWRKQNQELILMIWRISDQVTGFAWGVGKK